MLCEADAKLVQRDALLPGLGTLLDGDDPGSDGTITIQGIGSSWTNTQNVFVGNFGTGDVAILDGASASSATTKIGDEIRAVGSALVDGPGSTWESSVDLIVGNHGSGTMTVSNGGLALAANGFIGDDPGSLGNVTITGAASSWACTNQLTVGRLGEGHLTVADGATATAPFVTINDLSSLNGDGTIQADVANAGTVAPGLSVGQLAIQGSYIQNSLGTLHTDMDSTGNDQLAVTGVAQLAGTLQLSFINGFNPAAGQEFVILTADSVLGTFDNVTGPVGLEVIYSAGAVTVVSTASSTPPNDFNAFRGFLDSGTLDDVLASDNVDLCHDLGITIFPTEAPITLDFDGTLPTDSPSSLSVTFESSANTPGLELTISFWNYNTNSWEVVGTAAQGFNLDVVRTFVGNPADHVEAGTGNVRTRYEVRHVSIIFQFPWTDCIDHVFWSTT